MASIEHGSPSVTDTAFQRLSLTEPQNKLSLHEKAKLVASVLTIGVGLTGVGFGLLKDTDETALRTPLVRSFQYEPLPLRPTPTETPQYEPMPPSSQLIFDTHLELLHAQNNSPSERDGRDPYDESSPDSSTPSLRLDSRKFCHDRLREGVQYFSRSEDPYVELMACYNKFYLDEVRLNPLISYYDTLDPSSALLLEDNAPPPSEWNNPK